MNRDIVNKIARLITDDPDILNESDFGRRQSDRKLQADPGDAAAHKAARRADERIWRHGVVKADQLIELYAQHAGNPTEVLGQLIQDDPGAFFVADWIKFQQPGKQEARRALASKLTDYAPNFERAAIPRIIALVEELWVMEGNRVLQQADAEVARADEDIAAANGIEAYLIELENKRIETRKRLNKALRQEEDLPEPEEIQQPPYPEQALQADREDIMGWLDGWMTKFLFDTEKNQLKQEVSDWLDTTETPTWEDFQRILKSYTEFNPDK
jgi:hypothetical protein